MTDGHALTEDLILVVGMFLPQPDGMACRDQLPVVGPVVDLHRCARNHLLDHPSCQVDYAARLALRIFAAWPMVPGMRWR